MSWVALIDQYEGRFDASGLARQKHPAFQQLRRGTLFFELDLMRCDDASELARFGGLSVRLDQAKTVSLCRGAQRSIFPACEGKSARLSFIWDVGQDVGAARLDDSNTGSTLMNVPLPNSLTQSEVLKFTQTQAQRPKGAVRYLGVSTRVEPFGPYPTLLKQTRILTADGHVPVSRIRRGDLVRSDTGDLVPVLHLVQRKLPARGDFAPIRLCAPAFGFHEDLFVAASQMLILRGTDIEYMFGSETVLMPARHLLGTPFARPASCGPIVTYYQLVLPRNEGLMAGNVALASMNIGRIRRKPDVLALSSLSGIDRNLLPEHAAARYQTLRSAEALALLDLRVA